MAEVTVKVPAILARLFRDEVLQTIEMRGDHIREAADWTRRRGTPFDCNEASRWIAELEQMVEIQRQLPAEQGGKRDLEVTADPVAIASTLSDVVTMLGDELHEQAESHDHDRMRQLMVAAAALLDTIDELGGETFESRERARREAVA